MTRPVGQVEMWAEGSLMERERGSPALEGFMKGPHGEQMSMIGTVKMWPEYV